MGQPQELVLAESVDSLYLDYLCIQADANRVGEARICLVCDNPNLDFRW